MHDSTPAPFGDVTRRWTALDSDQRQRHAARLLGHDCGTDAVAHVDRPGLDAGACYRRLVPAAAAGDPVALDWLATTHHPPAAAGRPRPGAVRSRPQRVGGGVPRGVAPHPRRRRPLGDEVAAPPVARTLTNRLSRVVAGHLRRRRCEGPSAAAGLHARAAAAPCWDCDPHPDLTLDLDRALDSLDAPTREALLALANREPLAEVAARHGLSYTAVRQRVTRARRRLQPELAVYHRAAGR